MTKQLLNSISIGLAGLALFIVIASPPSSTSKFETASFCLLAAIYIDGRLFLYKE